MSLEITGAAVSCVGFGAISLSQSTDGSGGDADALTNGATELSDATPEVAISLMGTGAVGSSTGTSSTTSEGQPDAVVEVFFRNQMPYTATEKRAEQIYGALHRNKNILMKPVLIADSQDALETIWQALGNSRGESVLEKLDLYEKLLEKFTPLTKRG